MNKHPHLKPHKWVTTLAGALALAASVSLCRADHFTSIVSVGAGNSWNGNYWLDQTTGSSTLTGPPTPGNTYELIPNGTTTITAGNDPRTRTPAWGTAPSSLPYVVTFPGDSLQLDLNTDLRLKGPGTTADFPGPGGGQPGLILNGGLINMGDDGQFTITGIISVTDQSYINPATSGSTADQRSINIAGKLIGSGNLALINGGTLFPTVISGNNNTFSGKWIVGSGYLLASGTGSLGTNDITVDPLWPVPSVLGAFATPAAYQKAILSINYPINSAGTLILTNGGIFSLHQNCCFSAVIINGTALSAGTHNYADLLAAYPANFASGGWGTITVQPYGTPAAGVQPPTFPTQTWISADVGGPTFKGSVVNNGDGTVDILGGGNDIWGNSSQFHYYYAWALGQQWDVSCQVKAFNGPDAWSKVELLVATADPNVGPQGSDAFIAMMDTLPSWLTVPDGGTGVNTCGVDQFRTANNGASDWLQVGTNPRASYPDNWLRINRNGSVFTVYSSPDGNTWKSYLVIDTSQKTVVGGGGTTFGTAWPNLVTVGVAVTAHNDGYQVNGAPAGADATIANLQASFPPFQAPTTLGVSQPIQSGVTNAFGCEGSLTFVATNNAFPVPTAIPVIYQWYKNGSPIASATGSSHTWLLDNSDNGATYYCTATLPAPYNSITVTSGNAKVGVTTGVTYNTGLKNEMFANTTSRVEVERGNVGPAASITPLSGIDNRGGYGNNYVNRLSGWFTPPTTDSYVFFVACDDDSDLFLSTDATMANKRLVAQQTGYSGFDNWISTDAQTRSDSFVDPVSHNTPFPNGIPLNAGEPYYIELVHHQGGGGDNFSVTYQTETMMTDGNWPNTFTNGVASLLESTNAVLSYITRPSTTLVWSLQPSNTVATAGLAGTFYSRATSDGELPPTYQWYRGGVAITGGTGSSYSIPTVSAGDNGATFTVVATSAEGELSITSSVPAVLNVALPVLERGWAKMEYWYSPNPGIGNFLLNATNLNASYSVAPNYTIFEPAFEGNSKQQAPINYTSRLSAFFYPPRTGDYVFFVNSDDPGNLFVSTDSSPTNAVLVAQETGWSDSWTWNGVGGGNGSASAKRSDQWTAPDGTQPFSAGIHMIAGQAYYVALIHADTGGGNNCEATFKLTTDNDPVNGSHSAMTGNVIGTCVPRSFSLAFAQQPANQVVPFGGVATFTAVAATDSRSAVGDENDPSTEWTNSFVAFQWTRNGTPISGATGSSFGFGPVSPSDSAAQFACQIRSLGYVDNNMNPVWSNSVPVTLTVSGSPVYESGFVLHQYYALNPGRAAVENNQATTPTWLMAEPSFEADPAGTEYADNFTDQLIGFFIPPVTGDYVFFCNSDDDADLLLSTDSSALNRRLIARETGYATALAWGASGGTVSQVRSDTFVDPATGKTLYSDGIHLVAGQKYFMQCVHHQGGGGSESCVNAILIGDATPNAGTHTTIKGSQVGCYVPRSSFVGFTTQPTNITVANYTTASFSATGTTDSQVPVGNDGDWRTQMNNFLFFQWYKNGTPIVGANSSTLTLTDVLPSDNGSHIMCSMRALGYADSGGTPQWTNSVTAILNVTTSGPPAIVSSGLYTNATGGSLAMCITLTFSSPMDPVGLSNPANYTLGSGLTIASINVNSNTYRGVTLIVNGTPHYPLTITVNNLSALGGGPALGGSHSATVIPVTLTSLDIGNAGATPPDPSVPTAVYPTATNAFIVEGEGSDIWNNADGFNFLYEEKTGDFDVVVRQLSMTKVSNWTKGGLMIRETLDFGSRDWNIVNDPSTIDGLQAIDGSGLGADTIECNARTLTSGASASWATSTAPAPAYPNAWLRLTRKTIGNPDLTTNDIITGYYSTNGVSWVLLGQTDVSTNGDSVPLPPTVFVGIASTAHDNDAFGASPLQYVATQVYDSYNSSFVAAAPPARLTATVVGSNLVVSWTPAGGHLEWSPALGAAASWQAVTPNSNPATIPITSGAKFFRVVNP